MVGQRSDWSATDQCTLMTCARFSNVSISGSRSRHRDASVCSSARMTSASELSALGIAPEQLIEAARSAAAGQELTELVARQLCASDAFRLAGRFSVDAVIG